jgi:hypothetical protein
VEGEIAHLEVEDEALQAAIALKADQTALNSTDQALAALAVEVAGKQAQLLAGDVEGGTPLLLFADAEASGECVTCPEGTVLAGDTVRALKVSAPLQIQGDSQHVHVTLDASGLASQLDLASKQDQLGVGFVEGGHSLLEDGAIKAILGTAPVQVTSTATHVEVAMGESYFAMVTGLADEIADKASTSSLLAVKAIAESNNQAIADLVPQVEDNSQALTALGSQVAGKQDQLTAGTVSGGFQLLDPNTKVVRAIKGVSPVNVAIDTNHVEVFLDQNALGAQSATGPAGTLSLVNPQGKILRLLPGTSLSATSASASGYVELGLDPANVQLRAPFSVRDAAGISTRARIDTKAQFFTAMEVGAGPPPAGSDLAVGGSIGATGNISTSAALMANSLVPFSGPVVTSPYDFTIDGTLRCDVFQGRAASQVTCQDHLTVTGNLSVLGNFGWSPFWSAGMVSATGAALATKGRVGFTCTRVSVGRFRIDFATPHPDGDAYVINAVAAVFHSWVGLITPGSFEVNMASASNALIDTNFHFAVLA